MSSLTALFCYLTRAGVIARATTKEAIRQPLFPLLMALALLVLVTNTFVPFFSFGEDYRMLIDCGLATILICGLLLAVWTSSTSIADEIEGKTAMTLLSKPINRRQFVLGKFVGIMVAVFWLILPADDLFPGAGLLQGRLRFPRIGQSRPGSGVQADHHAATRFPG